MQKIIAHPDFGDITYIKCIRSRVLRIKISACGGIKVTLPFYVTYAKAQEFVEINKTKIFSILQKQRTTVHAAGANQFGARQVYSAQEMDGIRRRAKELLPARLKYYSVKLNLNYNRVFIKNNRSNWGSCSAKGNINLNMHLVNLPQELCDYVIIHELCHLVHRNHGKEFHTLVNEACGGKEKELSRQLREWTHLLYRIP